MIGNFRLHELNFLKVYTLAAEKKTVIPKPLDKDTSNASEVGTLIHAICIFFSIRCCVLSDITKVQKKGAKHGSISLYLAPESDEWEEIEWEDAIQKIAEKIKETRDATFTEKNDKGQVVNRTTGIAHVGSAALDNEECWLLQSIMRTLGLVYIEHQARI